MEPTDLPPEVAERAGHSGIELADGALAWSPAQCKRLLQSLEGTKIAVLEGEVFRSERIGLVPLYDGWTCPRIRAETATEYAQRSREMASQQISKRDEDNIFFSLRFSDQRDAA